MPIVIPRIIHQIWLGPLNPPLDALSTWKINHPDWEYHLWTEKNLPALVNQKAFDDSDSYPQKADILRYELLQQFGGVYIDADVFCVRPIDSLFAQLSKKSSELVAAYEGREDDEALIANTVMMSGLNNPFIGELVANIDVSQKGKAWEITGPQYLTDSIRKYNPSISLLPSKTFFPVHHKDKEHRVVSLSECKEDPEIFGIHMWSGTKRGYCPSWYRNPAGFIVYQVRKGLHKTFQIKE